MPTPQAWVEILGYAASFAVLGTFWMRTMLPLRVLALVSNVLFALYGFIESVHPVMVLHLVLFPINVYRLAQLQSLVRAIHSAASAEIVIERLIPFMDRKRFAAGRTLFRKGDEADRLYYIAEGTLLIEELNLRRGAGGLHR